MNKFTHDYRQCDGKEDEDNGVSEAADEELSHYHFRKRQRVDNIVSYNRISCVGCNF